MKTRNDLKSIADSQPLSGLPFRLSKMDRFLKASAAPSNDRRLIIEVRAVGSIGQLLAGLAGSGSGFCSGS